VRQIVDQIPATAGSAEDCITPERKEKGDMEDGLMGEDRRRSLVRQTLQR
jgi:hypothetical protein